MRVSCWLLSFSIALVIGCTSSTETSKIPAIPKTADSTEKVVRQIIANLLKSDPASIQMDKSIAEPPLKADDLDLVEIVMDLEERLNVEISDAAIEKYNGGQFGKGPVRITPNQLVAIVKEAPKLQQSKRKK